MWLSASLRLRRPDQDAGSRRIVCAPTGSRYRLLIGGSSTYTMQNPDGFALAAFFTTLIFIVVSWGLSSAGGGMRQRDERRVEAGLVTCRHVHVAKLAVRRRDASPGTHRDVRAVAAFFPRRETKKPLTRRLAPRLFPVVDVAGRERELAREARARVERAVGADRVRVRLVHVTRTVVDAVVRRETETPRLL